MFGLRGRINLTVRVTSENPDLHSGMMGGISVCLWISYDDIHGRPDEVYQSEPLIDLTRVLATLVEAKSSRVLVDGFYDQVRQMNK